MAVYYQPVIEHLTTAHSGKLYVIFAFVKQRASSVCISDCWLLNEPKLLTAAGLVELKLVRAGAVCSVVTYTLSSLIAGLGGRTSTGTGPG